MQEKEKESILKKIIQNRFFRFSIKIILIKTISTLTKL
ncbi:hypothetical protein S3E15_00069 [Bacillus mycoides]|uniref:Uncharacterized protein n=1 Tax=Bacillus mycoides TaxID=1405 RepID=A0AAP7WE99_BACMY|nr:hypothetical protein S3E15_00069 [Bacillus mycoides]